MAQTDSSSRLPDVITLNLGWVSGAGGGVSVSVDWRHLNVYAGPVAAVGAGSKFMLGLTGSWVLGSNGPASAQSIQNIYSGFGTSQNGGFVLGGGSTQGWSSGAGLTTDVTLGMPGAGYSAGMASRLLVEIRGHDDEME